jgi:very-short-patch-repair endonuclease
MNLSQLEEAFAMQIHAYELPEPVRQYRMPELPERRYTYDFAWIEQRLLVEVQGGLYMAKGGHNTANGIDRDCEKIALAMVNGYRVLPVTGMQVRDGRAIAWVDTLIREATNGRK